MFHKDHFTTIYLLRELVYRDLTGRYNGSFIGALWSLIHPIFMLGLYTLAFGVILKSRWGFSGGVGDYAFILFLGMIVLNAFTEVISKASIIITNNPNLVKRVVFPLELFPIVVVVTAFVHGFISLGAWFVAYLFFFGIPNFSIIYLPLLLICYAPLLLGLALLFSTVGVLFKDIRNISEMLSHVFLFISPVFYGTDSAPPVIRAALQLNPLTFIIEQLRDVLFFGRSPSFTAVGVYFFSSSLFAFLCYIFFRRLRPSFSDLV